jgi:arsenate reductase
MKVLYICTHNRCRSILSEAITRHLSNGRIIAKSAGSQPSGEVHPLSLKYLSETGISIDGLQSQSWDDFEDFAPDIVITVCDSAANESCPVWFGSSLKVHWGLTDPSKLVGSETELKNAFHETIEEITQRVKQLLAIDIDITNKAALTAELEKLGAK